MRFAVNFMRMNLVGRYAGRQTIKCPRCGEKCLQTQPVCPECGLVFSRLSSCTNKAARQRLKMGEKKNVLMVTKIPADRNFWVLLFYSIFLGLFGAHYYYVYRWKTGVYCCFSFIVSFCFAVPFNAAFLTWIPFLKIIIIGYVAIYGCIWLYSIFQVVARRFKIPVSVPYKEFKLEETK